MKTRTAIAITTAVSAAMFAGIMVWQQRQHDATKSSNGAMDLLGSQYMQQGKAQGSENTRMSKPTLQPKEFERITELYGLNTASHTIDEHVTAILAIDTTEIGSRFLHGSQNSKDGVAGAVDADVAFTLPMEQEGATFVQLAVDSPLKFAMTFEQNSTSVKILSTLPSNDPLLTESYVTPQAVLQSDALSLERVYYFFIYDKYILVYSDTNDERVAPASLNEIITTGTEMTTEEKIELCEQLYSVLPEFRATMFQVFDR